ncbi:unnamed protein product [Adineta steineri]|uniref:Uncharacterized protein n=2 Tax=Adineta steineri TaxID=433720 RepID=A0A819EUH1_9BILA|nr:unnamed protein product [Adineta steineri]
MNNVSSLRIGFISNATFIARLIDQTLSNISCMQCTCTALINSAIAWNCITINNTCQLIKNYSLTDIGIMTNNYGIFFFQQFPFQLTTNQINEETTNPIDMITTTETIPLSTTTEILSRLTHPNDAIFGICNTIVGGDSTPSDISGSNQCNFYPGEMPANVIDNDELTKYTNFGNGTISTSSITQGCYTGFYVTLSNSPSVLKAVQFRTGNDNPNRDPITITIEGTNSTLLTVGNSWILIYSGSSGLDNDPGRYELGLQQTFNNTIAYTSYRLLVTTKRAIGVAVQYSEAFLFG